MHSAVHSSRATRRAFACTRSLSRHQRIAIGHATTGTSHTLLRQLSSPRATRKGIRRYPDLKRHFSETRNVITNESLATKPKGVEQVLERPIISKSKSTKRPQASQIRESLRAWSTQNERLRQEQMPDTLPYEGRIRNIPNALFIAPDLENEELEVKEYHSDEQDDGSFSLSRSGRMLRPGSLMSHSDLHVGRQNVVYIGNNGIQSLLLLSDGRWAALRLHQKREALSMLRHYVIPEFLTSEEVDMVREHMPKQVVKRGLDKDSSPNAVDVFGTLPDHIVERVLPKLRDFKLAETQFVRDHQTQLEQIFEKLALADEWRSINILDLPPLVLGIEWAAMSGLEKKAFTRHVCQAHPLMVPCQTAETITLHFAPKSMDENIKKVQEWARLYQEAAARASQGKNVSSLLQDNPLSTFIDKARRIITKSRKIRTPTSMGVLGPALKEASQNYMTKMPTGEEFTENDKKIIQYLWDVSVRRPISSNSMAHASLIVRAIGAYPNLELGGRTVRMLLQEIGCLDPWSVEENLSIPLLSNRTSAEARKLNIDALRSLQSVTDWKTKISQLPDSMDTMRKDWGQLEIFCIDDSKSKTIEDGLSIEPASEIEDGYWMRAHFSHPTAHLTLDHPIIEYARKRGTTYFGFDENEPTSPMLPVYVLRQFTLRNDGPCLTVSTLLSKDGRVHDIKVEAGIVRNIQRLDSAAVDEALNGVSEKVQGSILAVGKVSRIPGYDIGPYAEDNVKSESVFQDVTDFLPQLDLMKQLFTARRMRRLEEVECPAEIPRMFVPGPRVLTHLPESHVPGREFSSYHWTSDPGIVIECSRQIDTTATHAEHRGENVTAQAMRLAAESMGKWLSDRKIPAVFLGNDEASAQSIQELNEKGRYEETEKPLYIRTSYPTPFYTYNMKQYAACSSPLRKFIDMLTHFQVDAYLKAQASSHIQVGAQVQDESILALSRVEVEKYLAVDVYASDTMDHYARGTRDFWIAQALFRAFHFREAALPEIMEVFLQQPAQRNIHGKFETASGTLLPWGLRAIFEPSPGGYENMANIYHFLPTRLISIDPFNCVATVCATGPPTAEPGMSKPIVCVTPDNILPPRGETVFRDIEMT